MNYYQVLRVSPGSSQVDIDRAYQKLAKEAKFDANMSRKDIETAYRILSDPTQKALYDAALAADSKKVTMKIKKETQKGPVSMKQKVVFLVVLTLITIGFFFYRYGWMLRSFSPGDVIVYKYTGKVVGTVVSEQEGHAFGKIRKDAYLVRTPKKGDVWIPKEQIQIDCRKKK